MPTIDDIYEFIKAFNDSISGSPPGCYIVMLIYINRLITFTEMPMTPVTWRPLIFTSLLVAHKVLDDRIYANTDFTLIYNFFDTKELGQLELSFIGLLSYNLGVSTHLYAKYYFELNAVGCYTWYDLTEQDKQEKGKNDYAVKRKESRK